MKCLCDKSLYLSSSVQPGYSHLWFPVQALHVGCSPIVLVPEFCIYLPESIVTFRPLYLEWEDSSAGPTLICVVVVVIVIIVVVVVIVMCVCWLCACG